MNVRIDLNAEHYALSVQDVIEVVDIGDLTPVPGAPRTILGIRNLRGEALPVIDLARLLNLGPGETPQRMVVAQAGKLRAGLAVRSVLGVDEVPEPDIATDTPGLRGATLFEGDLIGHVDVPAILGGLERAAS
jgi:purine-binding chemotaxis protein CheW